jgi:hypothetical protein
LPGRNQETSLLAAVANAYGNKGPNDAVNLLSDITWKELLTYEEIKAVLYLFKTDGESNILFIRYTRNSLITDEEPVNRYVFGIYMMLPFENKASPLEDDVASNQMLNCLFPMAVKLYEVKNQASVLFDKLQQSDTELLQDITQPTFNSERPNIVVFGICVCGNSWFVLGLELNITGVSGKYLGVSDLQSRKTTTLSKLHSVYSSGTNMRKAPGTMRMEGSCLWLRSRLHTILWSN